MRTNHIPRGANAHHVVTFPDGKTDRRTSERIYTHAVIGLRVKDRQWTVEDTKPTDAAYSCSRQEGGFHVRRWVPATPPRWEVLGYSMRADSAAKMLAKVSGDEGSVVDHRVVPVDREPVKSRSKVTDA